VRHGWFTEPSNQLSANNPSTPPIDTKDEPMSPTQKQEPPIPVIANWFNKLEAVVNKESSNNDENVEIVDDSNIESVLKENSNTCEVATKDLLNEMFDSLVNEYNTMEILECSGETETMKRRKSDSKSAENESVETSQLSENGKGIFITETKIECPNDNIVPPTPQTPKQLRKLFQEPANFDKEVTKSTDLAEFREGVKGKVKESRENFLKQTSTESAYQQEKHERKSELLQLINRPGQVHEDNESAKKDLLLREERNKELEELCKRKPENLTENKDKLQEIRDERSHELSLLSQRKKERETEIESLEDKTKALKDERLKELEELANRKVEFDWTCDTKEKVMKEERARELYNIANRKEEQKFEDAEVKRDEIMRQERAEELRQISSYRSQTSSDFSESKIEQTHDKKTMDDDLRGNVRNTAAAWKERERKCSQSNEEIYKELPSRRIGSLLKNDPDYWSLDEPEFPDLPAPPPELAETVPSEITQNPPPPPRQSSRGKLEEYTRDPGWNAPWRKS